MITPFHRLYVDYMVIGTTRVTWELNPNFPTAPFMSFQLQANRNADEPNEWVNTGDPVVNQFFALDTTQRQFGKSLRINYRVVLTMPTGATYTSDNAEVLGNLTKHQWSIAKAIARRGPLKAKSMHSFEGWLLKRGIQGAYCTCVDPITHGIMNSNHTLCGGTGRLTGYWLAGMLKMFDLSPEGEETKHHAPLSRGTINDATNISGRCVGFPLPQRLDVWVDAHSGRRYYVLGVTPENELNRVPILVGLKLKLAEFSDVIYTVPLGTLTDEQIQRARSGKAGPKVWRNQDV
jgi:hypothetical protein